MKLHVCVIIIVCLTNQLIAGYGNFGGRGRTSGGRRRPSVGSGSRPGGGGRTLGGGGRSSGRRTSVKLVCRYVDVNSQPVRPTPTDPEWNPNNPNPGRPTPTDPEWNPNNPNPGRPTDPEWNPNNPNPGRPTDPEWNPNNPNPGRPTDPQWNPNNPNPGRPTDPQWNPNNPVNTPAPTNPGWNPVDPLVNNCSPNPCQNGGFCVDRGNYFTCTCQIGYEGQRCETESTPTDVCSGSLASGTCDFYNCFVNCDASSAPVLAAASGYCSAFEDWDFDEEGEAYISDVIKCQGQKLGPFIISNNCRDVDDQAYATLIGQTKESDCFYQNGKFCDVMGKPQNAEAAAKIFASGDARMGTRMFEFFKHIYEADCPGTTYVFKNNFSKPFMNSMRNMMRMRMRTMRGQGDK